MASQVKTIFEDKNVLVVDKPAGLAVHSGPGLKDQTTLVDLIKDKVQDSDPVRPGIVHRLDKDTSGVMIIAKNTATKRFLQKQFRERQVEKTYIALVHGQLEHPEANLDLPVGRSRKHPTKRAVLTGGKPAQTHYQTLKTYPGYSLLELHPKTGRTHQLRVQLAHLGHPVVGDSLYHKAQPGLNRHFLHATSLELKLPGGEVRRFQSALAKELKEFLDQIVYTH